MEGRKKPLPDHAARFAALTELDLSLLVEAGAGIGQDIDHGRPRRHAARPRRRAEAYRGHHFHRVRGQRIDEPHLAFRHRPGRRKDSRGS